MDHGHFVDRRGERQPRFLADRRRFIERARGEIKKSIRRGLPRRGTTDTESGEEISIPTRDIKEPTFRHSRDGGIRKHIFPGNYRFNSGDTVQRPKKGGGNGRGREGSNEGEGEDEFRFVLSRDEFLDLLFEDLELPDMVKQSIKEIFTNKYRRAGFTISGIHANLDIQRTMRQSYARRIAFRRQSEKRKKIKEEIFSLERRTPLSEKERARLKELQRELENIETALRGERRMVVPFIDPIDLRYRHREPKPEPNTQAVMFCLMDVSASMEEHEKTLAKTFFLLLFLFLKTKYDRIEVVRIRHTHEAEEVDDHTFFHDTKTGGTVVSTAFEKMREIVKSRFPPEQWNIYAAQASDGDDWNDDLGRAVSLLRDAILPITQYFAYLEVGHNEPGVRRTHGSPLWQGYEEAIADKPNFAMKRADGEKEVYPVFRELFEKKSSNRRVA